LRSGVKEKIFQQPVVKTADIYPTHQPIKKIVSSQKCPMMAPKLCHWKVAQDDILQ
jgi:hypothetical protein